MKYQKAQCTKCKKETLASLIKNGKCLSCNRLRYLFLPSGYSGDVFHIASALELNPDLKAVAGVTQKAKQYAKGKKVRKDKQRNNQIDVQTVQYLKDIGLNDRMIYIEKAKSARSFKPQYYQAADELLKKKLSVKLGMTWSSTSGIMQPILKHYGDVQKISAARRYIVKKLRKKLPLNISQQQKDGVEKKLIDIRDEHGNELPLNLTDGKILLINMRYKTSDHLQHNSDEQIYAQIYTMAKRMGFIVKQVDDISESAKWVKKYDNAPIPIFRNITQSQEYGYSRGDKREFAYFWECVKKDKRIFGVIGGRSGSLDIAAFSGVNVLCWDVPPSPQFKGKKDGDETQFQTEYERLLLTAPLLSIIERRLDLSGMSGLLDESALRMWLCGVKGLNPLHNFSQQGQEPLSGIFSKRNDCETARRSNSDMYKLQMFDLPGMKGTLQQDQFAETYIYRVKNEIRAYQASAIESLYNYYLIPENALIRRTGKVNSEYHEVRIDYPSQIPHFYFYGTAKKEMSDVYFESSKRRCYHKFYIHKYQFTIGRVQMVDHKYHPEYPIADAQLDLLNRNNLTVSYIEPDGNCAYYCFMKIIKRLDKPKKTVEQLRKRVADFLASGTIRIGQDTHAAWDLFKNFLPQNSIKEAVINQIRANFAFNGEGGELPLYVLSCLYNVGITVVLYNHQNRRAEVYELTKRMNETLGFNVATEPNFVLVHTRNNLEPDGIEHYYIAL